MGAPPTRFTIDSRVTPAHIDFLNSRHQVGIYELKGDTLKICIGMDGDRPTSFRTEKHTDHTYYVVETHGWLKAAARGRLPDAYQTSHLSVRTISDPALQENAC